MNSARAWSLAGVLVALLLLTGLTGCGERAEKRFFVEDFAPAREQLSERKAAIARALRSVRLGNTSDARRIDGLTVALIEAGQPLGELDPPDSQRSAYAAYVMGFNELVTALRGFARALGAGSEEELDAAAEAVTEAISAMSQSESQLDELAQEE